MLFVKVLADNFIIDRLVYDRKLAVLCANHGGGSRPVRPHGNFAEHISDLQEPQHVQVRALLLNVLLEFMLLDLRGDLLVVRYVACLRFLLILQILPRLTHG